MTVRKGKKNASWRRDWEILERLAEHADLVRAGWSARQVCEKQGILPRTFYRDRERMTELAHELASQKVEELVAEADAWYRQAVLDADRRSAKLGAPEIAIAAFQGNKIKAVEGFAKLHGLALDRVQHSGELQVRQIVGVNPDEV